MLGFREPEQQWNNCRGGRGIGSSVLCQRAGRAMHRGLRWEFIKENKKLRAQENTLSTKKKENAIKKKEKKENTLSI